MKRILFVEDADSFLETLVDHAQRRGLEAEGVSNAQDALFKIRMTRYDAVIIDASEDVPVENYNSLSLLLKNEFPRTLRIALTGQLECARDPLAQEWYDCIIIKAEIGGLASLYERIKNDLP